MRNIMELICIVIAYFALLFLYRCAKHKCTHSYKIFHDRLKKCVEGYHSNCYTDWANDILHSDILHDSNFIHFLKDEKINIKNNQDIIFTLMLNILFAAMISRISCFMEMLVVFVIFSIIIIYEIKTNNKKVIVIEALLEIIDFQ